MPDELLNRALKEDAAQAIARDQRFACACIVGAVCPTRGIGAALIMTHANIAALNAHLEEITTHFEPASNAVVIINAARKNL